MTLKQKRTLPVLVLLLAILSFLVIAIGNQPILAYGFFRK
jgi:hypothetical protein